MNSSLAEACWWTLARTLILCFAAWPVTVGIERFLRSLSDRRQPLAFALLVLPFLFPELLIGYTYRNTALANPAWAEWICDGLLYLRIVPAGTVALLASPASLVSSAARHCQWMLWRANPTSLHTTRRLLLCYLYGPVRRAIPALALMSLISFQEFELAALLQTASWTDWFIAAQRVGLDRTELMTLALWPATMQLMMLMAAFIWFAFTRDQQLEQVETIPMTISRPTRWVVIAYLAVAATLGGLIPLGTMARNLPSGLRMVLSQSTQWSGLGREILIASMISIFGATTAWFVTGFLSTTPKRFFWKLLLLPGLSGSLLLSLASVVLFQHSWLRPFYDTPFPWALTLAVWLLPRASLLRYWVGIIVRTEAVHVAQLVADPDSGINAASVATTSNPAKQRAPSFDSGRLLFRLRDQPQWLAVGFLFYWAYLDLSTAYLLAPSGMNSGLVRLYNFMHFGRSAALSAEAFLFFGIPLAGWCIVFIILTGRSLFRVSGSIVNPNRQRRSTNRSAPS